MQPKPIARIQIALYADGRVMSGAEGALDKATLARGLALATQGLLNKIDAAEKQEMNGIEIPPANIQKQLVRP